MSHMSTLDIVEQNMESAVIDKMHEVWREVGDDVVHDSGREEFSQLEVVELVLDSLYKDRLGDELYAWWWQQRLDRKMRLGKRAFPQKRYGW